MRTWHLSWLVMMAAFGLALARNEAGRVMVIVFLTGLGVVLVVTLAILGLFRSLQAAAEARGLIQVVEALVATMVILVLASGLTSLGVLVGFQLVLLSLR